MGRSSIYSILPTFVLRSKLIVTATSADDPLKVIAHSEKYTFKTIDAFWRCSFL